MPTAKYKIFYTDHTTLLWSDIAPNGDPKLIPATKRTGVHSVIQQIDNDTMREVVEQYHYIFSIRDQRWVGVGLDGLLDHIVSDFDNIRCVMHGRTMATDAFWGIKGEAATDTDIIGGISAATWEENAFGTLHKYRKPYYQSGLFGASDDQYWLDMARHHAYPTDKSEKPIYGYQNFYG